MEIEYDMDEPCPCESWSIGSQGPIKAAAKTFREELNRKLNATRDERRF